jgi:hypothetical protein
MSIPDQAQTSPPALPSPPVVDLDALVGELEEGDLYLFADWPIERTRSVTAGVYTIWEASRFWYVGVAGRPAASTPRPGGLFARLNAHASGRRSGGQFCVYVGDRIILPELALGEIQQVARGELSLDARIRACVRGRLSFRFVAVSNYKTALAVEGRIKQGRLRVGKPLLNPV